MVPRQPFFDGKVVVIRPLALVSAASVERLRERLGLPVIINPCPSANRSKRQEIRDLLQTLYRGNRKVRGNIFRAMSHVNLEYLPPPLSEVLQSGRCRGWSSIFQRLTEPSPCWT
jgi:tRNA 2-thiocytidine biosynthesis protein TtcA